MEKRVSYGEGGSTEEKELEGQTVHVRRGRDELGSSSAVNLRCFKSASTEMITASFWVYNLTPPL